MTAATDAESRARDDCSHCSQDGLARGGRRGVAESLMQLHQEKIARESQKGDGKKKEWKWSREGDLDKGRRIDKSALHSMLGSAEENLKTKFEGSFTSRFT